MGCIEILWGESELWESELVDMSRCWLLTFVRNNDPTLSQILSNRERDWKTVVSWLHGSIMTVILWPIEIFYVYYYDDQGIPCLLWHDLCISQWKEIKDRHGTTGNNGVQVMVLSKKLKVVLAPGLQSSKQVIMNGRIYRCLVMLQSSFHLKLCTLPVNQWMNTLMLAALYSLI